MNGTTGASPILGIDLGTTFSLAAVVQAGAPVILPNALGELLTPSAVSVSEDATVLVGAPALARATTHPQATALAFKRDMGTARVFDLLGMKLTPQELSAFVLGALKRDAEAELGMPVTEAVVTVPAYFDDHQRQATRAAAEIAGLKVERLLNEPTAAAIAYGLHERHRELRAVVLDLGGGTFDVTVLEIMEGVIEIQSSAGDSRLGGEDFTAVLAEWAAAQIPGFDLGAAEPVGRARLRAACEAAKRRLATAAEDRILLPQLQLAGGGLQDVEIPLPRAQAEQLWQGLLERLRPPVLRALGDAKVSPRDVDEVLLVGGATRMPCMIRMVAQLFGRMPQRSLPPDEAVALGAALQAGLKQGERSLQDLVVTDVAPFSMGIDTVSRWGGQQIDGVFAPILERGTVIPASRVRSFVTMADNQSAIDVAVYQGEHPHCRDNRLLGRYLMRNLPPAPAGREGVEVRFTYNLDGLLEVEMTVLSSGATESFVLERTPGRLTPEEIERARRQMVRLKFHPREALPNVTALARADALFVELTGEAREELGIAISVFRAALEGQDPAAIDATRGNLNAIVLRRR
jgi:molecular chaperone HscC